VWTEIKGIELMIDADTGAVLRLSQRFCFLKGEKGGKV